MKNNINSNFDRIPEEAYKARINTPSRSRAYFESFHLPLVNKAVSRNGGTPINMLDVACGYCHELDFLADNPSVRLFGIDIAEDVLNSARRRLPKAKLITADVRNYPKTEEPMDVAIGVNAVVYHPQHMLRVMHDSLKGNGEAAVNFRDFNNPLNRQFYRYYLSCGATLNDETATLAGQSFALKVLDYRQCADALIKNLDRQMYLQGRDDIERLIRHAGFEATGHEAFRFSSPANPENEMDVYTLRKSKRF